MRQHMIQRLLRQVSDKGFKALEVIRDQYHALLNRALLECQESEYRCFVIGIATQAEDGFGGVGDNRPQP